MKATFVLLFCGFSLSAAPNRVVTYPAPEGEPLSAEYQIEIGEERVATYSARVLDPPFAGKEWDYGGAYSFANFDVQGPVDVRITSNRSLRNTVILPARTNVTMRLETDNALVVSLPGPCKLSIEPDGKKAPLLLFANPIEEAPPTPETPGVIYFRPGIHQPGRSP